MQEPRSYQVVSLNEDSPGNGNNGHHQMYAMPLLQSQSNVDEDEESIDLRQLLTVAKHRMRLIFTVAMGVTAAVGVWTLAQQSRYQGRFQLLVGDPTQQESQIERAILQGDGKTDVDYKTQIEVLRSPSVLEPIIQKLAQRYPEITYGDLINPKKSPLQINQIKDTKILDISYLDENPEKIKFVLDNLAEAYLRYSLAERQIKINQGIDFVENQLPELYKRVDGLQEKLQKFRQKNNLLDPEGQAKDLSEQLITVEEKFFETQVKLRENQTLYGLLQRQLGLQPEEALAASYLTESPRYQKLLDQLQEIEVDLARQSSIWQGNSPALELLKERRSNLLPLLEREAQAVLGRNSTFTRSNTSSVSSPSQLRLDLNEKYIQAANEMAVLGVRENALTLGIKELNAKIRQMPVIAREFTDLKRQLDVATGSLNRFLEAQEKLQLEAAQQALPWQMIAKPELPVTPIFPRPALFLTMGALGGLLLGMIAALLAERLDPVFHSAEELKESIPVPILGFIPLQKELKAVEQLLEAGLPQLQIGNAKVVVGASGSGDGGRSSRSDRQDRGSYASSSFLEAFRSLNTNIRLLGSDTRINSIVISSSVPAEGKSTVSVNLAQAAAAMGQRVLLIDADLRRPQVHHRLGVENNQGLSNVIATGVDLKSAIKKVPQWENLSILTAGDIPPDPTRLLSSTRMQQVMEQLEKQGWFDLIIYDTPPVLGFADGKILAASTNGIILVAKMGKTDRTALKQTIDELKMSRVPILGVVANGVNRHGHSSYYYYDRYYGRNKTTVD